jgi:hypothetical protein
MLHPHALTEYENCFAWNGPIQELGADPPLKPRYKATARLYPPLDRLLHFSRKRQEQQAPCHEKFDHECLPAFQFLFPVFLHQYQSMTDRKQF